AALDAAGWRRGADGVRTKNGRPLALDIIVPNVSLPRMRYADLIQDQLNRAGFRIEVARLAIPQWSQRQQKGDYDLSLLAQNTDPGVSGVQQFWSRHGLAAGSNYLRYESSVADAYLDSAANAATAEDVKRYARLAFRRIVDDVPAVWLYSAVTTAAANRRIELAPFALDGWWGNLADWSIPADKRIDRDRIGLRPAPATP
ncbi:MAG TPA: ABC transporter substrate-binding protein, partial [Gemmatimonadaceae bacterium]|nr:ABC transporter substrate-binding protein [Gemmatimonadaceae bacterium]